MARYVQCLKFTKYNTKPVSPDYKLHAIVHGISNLLLPVSLVWDLYYKDKRVKMFPLMISTLYSSCLETTPVSSCLAVVDCLNCLCT